MDWIMLLIGLVGVATWLYERSKSTDDVSDLLPPPRKYEKPKRPKNDDPDRWYG